MDQGSQEWFDVRRGKVTASQIAALTAKTKSGWGASRANYMAQIIAERLTGETAESYTNGAMAWGTDTEPKARAAYQFRKVCEVVEVGFIDHPTVTMSGASPDGLIGDDGLVEIKCPNTATHIDTMLRGAIPGKYVKQVQWQLACTQRDWCDFVSYDPRMPEAMCLFVKRIAFDAEMVARLETQVSEFLVEVETKITNLQASTMPPKTQEAIDNMRAG